MIQEIQPISELLSSLSERAKELNCLYEIEDAIRDETKNVDEVAREVVNIIPSGWQYPEHCVAEIQLGKTCYHSANFQKSPWFLESSIDVQGDVLGNIRVYYTKDFHHQDEGPFLKEERKLLNTIADQLAHFIFHMQLREIFTKWKQPQHQHREWWVIIDLLRRTDPKLLMRISRKMANYLCWSGNQTAESLLSHFSPSAYDPLQEMEDLNRPHEKRELQDFVGLSDKIFHIAVEYLGEEETLAAIQNWIKEDKSNFLVAVLENPASTFFEITDALDRYRYLDPSWIELSDSREKGFRVSLIRRLLSDQPQFIKIARKFIGVNDFYSLFNRIISPANGQGKLGGKSAGIFLASQILKLAEENQENFKNIKTPKTWYITSDGILDFMHYNNLEDVVQQKYKEISQVRQEYPYVIQLFKNSSFSPEVIKGLSMALDDFGEKPLVVRSSSLLEDRMGTAFAGKYKSLFIANQGTKQERLNALTDAIAEVYASTFGPDPIEYRAERDLLVFHEEMGIIIQEVVGVKVGDYFLPAYAGVAFSSNEFRWSPRIKSDDGLIRLVPGLGTRAVDRVSDDYPILIAPGQPNLRVNTSFEEIIRYCPKMVDVINLKTKTFESIEIEHLIRQYGYDFPALNHIVSVLKQDRIQQPMGLSFDPEVDEFVVTFEGLRNRTNFVQQIHLVLQELHQSFGVPVDLEFASNGEDFYLLQCRPQSYASGNKAATIPTDVPPDHVVFTANRFVSNGYVPDITHIVYINSQKYSELPTRTDLLAVGRAVGRLNKILPKRQFVLMGPGRWGSRGDIKLGVNVTYSEINNTAVLIEIARQKGNYVPELSFGTHFFQDLVEASIRYLPLYPDDPKVTFNEKFLMSAENMLPEMLPDFAYLADTIHVIDLPKSTGGQILRILLNADMDQALGMLAEPSDSKEVKLDRFAFLSSKKTTDDHWRWRLRMSERIASELDVQRFGVKNFFVFGSTKNATAGPASDIDLLIHCDDSPEKRRELMSWLEGWSICLSEMNFWRTGQKSGGLLDIHIVTDDDIAKKTSYAIKIGAVTDAARPLPTKDGGTCYG